VTGWTERRRVIEHDDGHRVVAYVAGRAGLAQPGGHLVLVGTVLTA